MFKQTLLPDTFRAIQLASQIPIIQRAYLAGKRDIAAMKIHALADRGTKRDFVDVYFLAKEYPLDEMLEFYESKYGNLKEQFYYIVRALDYFADAEHEKRPLSMLTSVDWEQVKTFFQAEAKRLTREKLGIGS